MEHATHEHPYIGCTIKELPEELQHAAASRAIELNPANAPAGHTPGEALPGRLVLLTGKRWPPAGKRLTVDFLDGVAADLRTRILFHMNAWGSWCNVRFTWSTDHPQVRITRAPGGGYWSNLGTDILHVDASKPTMNLDSFSMTTRDSEFYRVVRHETGHTLGFPHEHLRKEIIDRIDTAKAITYFQRTQGWSRDKVISNVLTPLNQSALVETQQPDPLSIMCYALPGSIMKDGVGVPGGTDIDQNDAQFAGEVYPGATWPTSIWPNGKAYFFKGGQYIRYDARADKADPGYPAPIAGHWPGFPPEYEAGVDALVVWNLNQAYFFKGAQYIRYSIQFDRVDHDFPRTIAGNWPGLFPDGIDAGVVWPSGKAYFFRGAQYIRYDIANDKADPGYPKPIAGNWPGFPPSFQNHIDSAVVWNNTKAYFFSGDQYIRYDITADATDAGYPAPIAANWSGLFASDIDA